MTDETLQPVHHTTCRICHAALVPILSLGEQHLSDFPASAGTKTYPAVPLELVRCGSPSCGLVQLAHTTPQAWLYGGTYWYRSGVNESMRAELRDVVEKGLSFLAPDRHLTVADIGANDGTLLSMYPEVLAQRHPVVPQPTATRIAWEPAKNLYAACRPHADLLFPDYFHNPDPGLHGKVDLLTMIACFYDIEDPHALVGDAAAVLAKTGVWVIQQAYLPYMLAAAGYDNIGHEHLEYYHLAPLEALLAAHGLEVFAVERRKINGGSFRVYVGWKGFRPVSSEVAVWRGAEAELFRDPEALWAAFAASVERRTSTLLKQLLAFKAEGLVVDLLGCSTKGNTLLQTAKIDARLVRQAWERSPEKWGRYVGVTGIPIVSEEEGRANPPDVLLTTIWQFRDSIVAREAAFLEAGGKILFPLPQVELLWKH